MGFLQRLVPAQPGFGAARPDAAGPGSREYDYAILDEIKLLLDFVAGCPDKTLRDLKVESPPPGAGTMPLSAVLCRIREIESAAGAAGSAPAGRHASEDWPFLMVVRDSLNALIRPASGLTVAYTSMVVGNRRGPRTKSRAELASRAYAGLSGPAVVHRWGQRLLIGMALALTLVATWDSAKVALGKSLLHGLQELRVQQADIQKEKVRIEEAFSQPSAPTADLFQLASDGPPPARKLIVRLCERPDVLRARMQPPALEADRKPPDVFESAAQQDVCDRDKQLADSFFYAHAAVDAYIQDWPALAGTGFGTLSQIGRSLGALASAACGRVGLSCEGQPDAMIGQISRSSADTEVLIAPVLVVLGNYVLPVIFALLGAAAFVVLDFYGKLRNSLLSPRDHVLSWIRLVLGSVIGACIGLFFSSYGPQNQGSQADLIGALTLSASGVGFIAGFGVEGVFAMLGTLVKRMFGGEAA